MELTTAPTPAPEVFFVLDTLPDWESLVAAAPAHAEVVRLDGNGDALAQMSSYMEGRADIGAIHIVSHGAPGTLQLGSATVNQASLDAQNAQWQAISRSLSADGDILLYGCDVAAGAQGQAFVQALAALTGADVAASTDLTGNAALCGNWVLESQTGAVQASTDWSKYTQFSSVLALQTIDLSGAETSGSVSSGTFTIGGLSYTVTSASGFTVTRENGGVRFQETTAAGDFSITITDPSANPQFIGKSLFITNNSTGGDPSFGASGSIYVYDGASQKFNVSLPQRQYITSDIAYLTSTLDSSGTTYIGTRVVIQDTEINSTNNLSNFFIKYVEVDLDATNTPVDNTPPTVSSLSSSTSNGSYKVGDLIAVQVNFSENVIVTGTPQLTLATGATNQVVNYSTGSGTSTLVFNYTVQSGDSSADLDYLSTSALSLNAGTIKDAAGNNATLTLPSPGAANSLGANKNIVIDGVVPTVSGVTSSTANGSYKAGDVISIQVNFSETVTVTGTPQLTLETGTIDRTINYASGSGSSTLTFNYTVQAGDTSADLDFLATNALALNAGTIKDAAGNDATLTLPSPGAANSLGANKNIVIDGVVPTVSGVTSSTANGSYKAGDVISIQVNFSETVTVTGTPQLTLETGTTDRTINYASGSGSSTLTFNYTVQAGDTSADLDFLATNALALNAGTIKDAAGNDATLTLPSPGAANSLGANKALVIDGSAPSVATIDRVGAATTNATSVDYTVTFSEGVSGVDTGDFVATAVSGTAVGTVSNVLANSATSYTVTVSGITGEGALRLDLKSSGTAIADLSGNPIAAGGYTAGQTITIDTTPANAAITVAPTAVGAGHTATVTFTFSEAVTGFDNADLSIAHGTLSPVASADGGTTWTGTFTPDTDTEVAANLIVLANSGVQDAAGNAGTGTTNSSSYTVDTKAPVFASAAVVGNILVLAYTEVFTLDATNPPAVAAFDVLVDGDANAVTAVAVNAAAKTVTLTLATTVTSAQTVTVAYSDPTPGNDTNAIQDATGNDAASLAATAVTNNTLIPSPPPAPTPDPPPSTTVDGVPVVTESGPGGSTIFTVPVVSPTRTDTPGTPSPLADIPIVKGNDGHPIVQVSVPVGVGVQAEGLATSTTGAAALAELGLRIERVTGDSPELTNAGNVFYATLAPDEPLSVQILKPSIGAGYNGTQPLVITGSEAPVDGKQAIILDARALPSGTVIQVDNIDFIAVVGDVRLVGGAGQNVASGDSGVQYIVLGPDDDVIHGGGGNDTVGSEGGDDQVYGDSGDDIVFGGAGNDLLSGGAGNDRLNGGTGFDVAIQEGARTDYTVTRDGAGIKLTHTATGASDWLVDVEQVRFESGPILTVAHSAADEAGAYLFQKWIGRDLTQAEGAIIQSLAGKSALEVATLFAQVFPEQSAGKTPAQLLDGMDSAGAVRIDAVREITVTGDAGNNTITPVLGLARYVNGGAGIDTVVLPATLGQTFMQHNASGSITLQRLTDGAMLDVTGVERVQFNDTQLALDLNGNAGQAAKLLGALAGPGILSNKGLVGEVIRLLDAGTSSQTVARLGLQLLGASTPSEVAQTLWSSITGHVGTSDEIKQLTDLMAGGISASELVVIAANLDATAVRIDLVGLTATGIEFT